MLICISNFFSSLNISLNHQRSSVNLISAFQPFLNKCTVGKFLLLHENTLSLMLKKSFDLIDEMLSSTSSFRKSLSETIMDN